MAHSSTFADLRSRYSENDLSYFPGDRSLRKEMFAPFFENIRGKKAIYFESSLACIAWIEDVRIKDEGVRVLAKPWLFLLGRKPVLPFPVPDWEFGANWESIRLCNRCLNVPHAGWKLWPEPEMVKAIQDAAVKGDDDALAALMFRGKLEGT